MSDDTLKSPYASLSLRRYPDTHDLGGRAASLRAWDSADEYLLQWLSEQGIPPQANTLIINDAFGALTLSLGQYTPDQLNDSFLSQRAAQENAQRNQLSLNGVQRSALIPGQMPVYRLVVIKIPKSLQLLEHQLLQLRHCIDSDTIVVAAGMVKHLPAATTQLLERVIGPTEASLAKKKARLFFSPVSAAPLAEDAPSDGGLSPHVVRDSQFDLELVNYPGTFSATKLDIGARLLLENLPALAPGSRVIDLGCGNGVLGIAATRQQTNCRVDFVDESYSAIDSARESVRRNVPESDHCHFHIGHSLEGFEEESADEILNNPPFHQQNAIGDFIANTMFRDAHRVLRNGSRLTVVANRHLGYHLILKKLFGNCRLTASNPKFVVLEAIKSRSRAPL